MVYWIISALSGIGALYIGFSWHESSGLKKLMFVLCCICVVYFSIKGYNTQIEQNKESEIAKPYFDLNPKALPNSYFKPKILFGKDCNYTFGKDGLVVLTDLFSYDRFTVSVNNGKMMLNATFRDLNDAVIATVEDNFVHMRSNSYDYNQDDFGFEIVTVPEKIVVYQLDYCDSTIYYSGLVFNKQTKAKFYVYPLNYYNKQTFELTPIINLQIPNGLIQMKFKYPREKYIHERIIDHCEFNALKTGYRNEALTPEQRIQAQSTIRGCQ